jgi:hypothetical protein
VALAIGDVVVVDTSADLAVTTTTTAQDTRPIGVVVMPIPVGATGPVQTAGVFDGVHVSASVTRGNYAETAAVATEATGNATARAGSFGVYVEGGTSPTVLLFGQTYLSGGGSGGSSFPWPSVTDYGAVGDGTTDDTAAIQAAITACAEYETLFFPIGTYKITSTLTLAKAIRLLGASAYPNPDTSPDGATIISMATNNTTAISQSATKRLGIEHMVIKNAGTSASGRGVYALGSVAFHHVLVRDFYDNLFIDGVSGGSYVTTIDESFFHAATRANIYLDGKVNNFRMRGGYISTGAYGLYASGGIFGLLVKGTAIESYTTAGIYIDGRASSQDTDSVSLEDLYLDVVAGTAPDIRIGATNTVYGVRIINPHIEAGTAGQTHISVNKVNRLKVAGGYIRSNSSNVSVAIDATNGSNVTLEPGKWDGAYSTRPASTKIIDPATSVTPTSIGSSNTAGTSPYDAAADHGHDGSAYIAKALVTTKGDLIAATASATPARLPVGSDGQVLIADAASTPGVKWSTLSTVAALDDLTDVTITSATAGDRLRYSGSAWVNSSLHHEPHVAYDGTVVLNGNGDPVMVEVA